MDTACHLLFWSFALSIVAFSGAQSADCSYHIINSSNAHGYGNVIKSPNFPEQYPPNLCIVWIISAEPGSYFLLRIMEMDLPGEVGKCGPSNDNIYISVAPDNQETFCGRITLTYQPHYQAILTPQNPKVNVTFISTSNPHKGRGFRALYVTWPGRTRPSSDRAIPSDAHSKENVDQSMTQAPPSINQDECNHVWRNTSSGFLPGSYITWSALQRCGGMLTWLVVAPKPEVPFPGATVGFSLNLNSCPSAHLHDGDSLEVFDGRNASAPLLIRCNKYSMKKFGRHTSLDSFFVRYRIRVPSSAYPFQLRFKRQALCLDGYINCFNEDACYHPSARCNRTWECPQRGRDELNCDTMQCPPGKYSCEMSNQHCYDEKDRCNGRGTCTNYKDEMNCDPSNCNQDKGLFLCSNGRCIYEKWHCDGTSDCADNSDEDGCTAVMSPRVIVVVVVGSLSCCLLLVVALGCVCKVYRLRQMQLSGGLSGRGACCHGHGRHDSPLTRQLAEMFRQRAPPPPYHEAMLTSRPYREVVGDAGEEGEGGALINSGRGRYGRGRRVDGGASSSARSQRRRGSGPSSVYGSQQQGGRRHRSRRQHREVHQQDISISHPAAHANTGFIEVGSLNLLGRGGTGQTDCDERQQACGNDPPPYSVSDPAIEEGLNAADEAEGSSSGDDVGGDVDGVERLCLRRQRKTRQSRSGRVEELRVGTPNSSMSCLEMSSVTHTSDPQAQTNGSPSQQPRSSSALPRGGVEIDECDKSEDDSYIEDGGEEETESRSLSVRSASILEPALSFQTEGGGEEDVELLAEEDSDSDCILLGEDDEDVNEDDSDTYCLISAVANLM